MLQEFLCKIIIIIIIMEKITETTKTRYGLFQRIRMDKFICQKMVNTGKTTSYSADANPLETGKQVYVN